MRQKTYCALLPGLFSAFLLVTSIMITAPPATSAQEDLWSEIGRHVRLDYPVGKQPEVDNQIHWYIQHPKALEGLLTNAQPYLYYVYQQIRERHLPAELALIPIIESNYNPFAQSAVGAIGLWQMMPATAADYGLKITHNFDQRLDILSSTGAALTHFASLYRYFNDWSLAIVAYDAGAGTIRTLLNRSTAMQRTNDVWSLDLPNEARSYLVKLIALATIIKNPQRFHVKLPPIANQPFFSTFSLNQTINLHQVSDNTRTDMDTLRRLNPGLNLQSTIVPKGNYALLIPKDKAQLLEKNNDLAPL